MKTTAIVTAGGKGIRLKDQTPKQFLKLAGLPIIIHTLRAFENAQSIDEMIVVIPETEQDRFKSYNLESYEITKIKRTVAGGETRQASVGNGLELVDEDTDFVAIHDAARCLITPALIDRAVKACTGWDGAIVALPVRDTLKQVSTKYIEKTVPRKDLWGMQTPQVFRFPFIRNAYRKAKRDGFEATDDAAIAEYLGAKMRVVEGSLQNLKITLPEDLKTAEVLLQANKEA